MRIFRAGPSAVLIEWADGSGVAAAYRLLDAARKQGRLRATEIVPAARTVLVDGVAGTDQIRTLLTEATTAPPPATGPSRVIEIPTVYDGADLDDVAQWWGTDRAGVVAVHTGTAFRVAFCGFAPGFAYLTGLGPEHHVPRRATPRTRVPAGTVALAGAYSGVYPGASPGGWQCIGRTAAVLFDLENEPPALLTPGATVRFVVAA
ncbi:allophanate hydrolase [Actinoplanes sp. SE50]|uniref:5-oxoprolinase subunit B family protein n=1 Tax=unclassified Actinoplanes TaxID=2626549 RepID=UPI00023EC5D5|nr:MULTISPECIES: allophanate hydrolase subunit 1 [unclassified Actinoplanes]AEV83631.1 Allophanate hydrolase subunit 1 [Actinoplanes sp. SE50/110]ATO82225.1 allophanate hydrolase [Actinoplanes sp. SE50]SLL99632.1 allophanate hydrolase [Actinoplanes sp. SE50/110]